MTASLPTYRFSSIGALDTTDETLRTLHEEVRRSDEAWRGAQAYGLDHDLVRDLVRDFIEATYAYQRVRYGSVRARLSVAAILR